MTTLVSATEIRAAGGIQQALAAKARAVDNLARRGLDASSRMDGASEARVMAEVVAELTRSGFAPPPSGGTRGFLLRVGQRRADLAGSDAGVPDVLVCWRGLPLLFGLEVKARTRGARLSGAQKSMVQAGCITVLRCAQDVSEFISRVESAFPCECRGQFRAALTRKG